jgi:hypothetical protein
MVSKNLNIKVNTEEERIIKSLRDEYCLNISRFLRLCLFQKFEELENEKNNRREEGS